MILALRGKASPATKAYGAASFEFGGAVGLGRFKVPIFQMLSKGGTLKDASVTLFFSAPRQS